MLISLSKNMYFKIDDLTWNNRRINRMLLDGYIGFWMLGDNFKDCSDEESVFSWTPKKKTNLLRDIVKYVKEKDIVYDIGAGVGVYSIRIANKVKGCKIYSFEPTTRSYERLRKNIAYNGYYTRIQSYNIAIANENEIRKFYISEDIYRSSLFEHDASIGTKIKESAEVACFKIDTLINEQRFLDPDIIKIDAEGAEMEILMGARELLYRKKPMLFIELHNERRKNNEVSEYLKVFGYKEERMGFPIRYY